MTARSALLSLAALTVGSATALAQAPQSAARQSAAPQSAAPQTQTIQQQNEEMLKELRAIRMLLEKLTTPQGQQQPTTARVTNLGGYAMGRADAPLTMVEFTDLQCPLCRQFVLTSFDEIKKNWIDT